MIDISQKHDSSRNSWSYSSQMNNAALLLNREGMLLYLSTEGMLLYHSERIMGMLLKLFSKEILMRWCSTVLAPPPPPRPHHHMSPNRCHVWKCDIMINHRGAITLQTECLPRLKVMDVSEGSIAMKVLPWDVSSHAFCVGVAENAIRALQDRLRGLNWSSFLGSRWLLSFWAF